MNQRYINTWIFPLNKNIINPEVFKYAEAFKVQSEQPPIINQESHHLAEPNPLTPQRITSLPISSSGSTGKRGRRALSELRNQMQAQNENILSSFEQILADTKKTAWDMTNSKLLIN